MTPREPSPPDRLSALDYSFLALDTPEAPLHVGWTMRFDGEPPPLAALRRHLDARLGFVPRFRRRVSMPALGLGDPRWVDDPGFDIAHHVHELTLAAPGGPAELRTLAGTLLSRPLDPGCPLWQLYLVRGVGSGGFALIGQAHHALVDGIAAIEVAMLLFTPEPPTREEGEGDWRPGGRPSPARATRAALGVRAAAAVRIARENTPAPPNVRAAAAGAAGVAGPTAIRGAARRAAGLPEALRGAAGSLERLTAPVPATALDRAVGPRRAVAYAQAPMDGLKAAGRRHGATLNDVLLTACSLAFGRALHAAGERAEDLRVLVPVSTRLDDPAALGNKISFMAVELPVTDTDPVSVLRTVRDRTRAVKAESTGGGLGIAQVVEAVDLLPAQVAGAAARAAFGKAAFNAIVSNVPGPEIELSLLGRPLRGVYPAVPVAPGRALSVGAISYLGRLHVGLYADADALPDLPAIARDVESALDVLRVEGPEAPTPWRAQARARRTTRR